MSKRTLISFLSLLTVLLVALAGCGQAQNQAEEPPETIPQTQPYLERDTTLALTALKGPTGMGFAPMLFQASRGQTQNGYEWYLATAPDEAAARLIKGEADIVALPVNLAANLYQKTEGDLQMLAINTLGVLYILENGDTVHSLEDLAGRTLCATGQGSTPEYILNALLTAAGVQDQVKVEFFSDHSELTSWMATGEADLAMLPEPNVTVALNKNQHLRRAIDLTAQWEQVFPDTPLVQGCIVAKKSFITQHPDAIATFLAEYQQSVAYALEDPKETAWIIQQLGVLDDAAIAEQALPNCNLCLLTGAEMRQAADQMFQVLYQADPASIGGELPPADLYYGLE